MDDYENITENENRFKYKQETIEYKLLKMTSLNSPIITIRYVLQKKIYCAGKTNRLYKMYDSMEHNTPQTLVRIKKWFDLNKFDKVTANPPIDLNEQNEHVKCFYADAAFMEI